ncbi:non-specific lipid transfer protein GPI-anchored 7-like isoform X1 [Zingiber officinale]|uniref:non-specific lipid transfer protein GPI-anchored 7-like isoform X1 n=1 Tax=Zingiber officinale TaxID=94328 RepID=UPI001C4D8D5E|nr:non-specific lipid transfer protein GPI-anchored 7-like isoform X1 [Zingiber officinale]
MHATTTIAQCSLNYSVLSQSSRAMEKLMATLLLVLALVLLPPGEVEAQTSQTCAAELVPCREYLNLTTGTPSDSCCIPMRNAVENELDCLCAILTDPNVSSAFNLTIERTTHIARACGIANLNGCSSGPSSSRTPPPPPPSGAGGNMIHRKWIGVPVLFVSWWIIAI